MENQVFDSLRAEHLSAVMEIEQDLFPSPWTEEMFRQEIEDNTMSRSQVVLRNGQVVGYMIVWYIHDEIHLLNLGVMPEQQRSGLGTAMVENLIKEGRRCHQRLVTLEVRESNHAARRLYEKFGFKPVVRRKNYYSDENEDAIVMVMSLGSSGESGRHAG